jgi:hypothetical protein
MKNLIIILGSLLVCGSSCKKNYSCECRNSFTTYPAGEVYATQSKADKKCKELSTGDTQCYVK